MSKNDFLIEIQCEELPPCALPQLIAAFEKNVSDALKKAGMDYDNIQAYATPRRLALVITALAEKQADKTVNRRGPALNQAFDADGKPTPACLGFAKSCGVTVDELQQQETEKGTWLYVNLHQAGKTATALMPDIIEQALKALPVPKWMHWGNHAEPFARPVHHVVMLYGNKVIPANIIGIETGNMTVGHRFLCGKPIKIKNASSYAEQLKKPGYVIADFSERKAMIKTQIEKLAAEHSVTPIIPEELLDEVTALVEWPVALLGEFDEKYLNVPSESLISAMQDHQKSFALVDEKKQLQNKFIFISNLKSTSPQAVIHGSERVMSARLADAEFFYHNDLKTKLIDRVDDLKHVTDQKKLGSLYDKAQRLAKLCQVLSNDNANAARAGLLAKTDLTTDMVFEFPELQGTIGYYYAKHNGEHADVAIAIKEQYLPRFADDNVAQGLLGICLSLADKIDSLVANFGLNQIPSGNKDPFALRRAALGIIRTVIENKLHINLEAIIKSALDTFTVDLPNQTACQQVIDFILERQRMWAKERGIGLDVIDSVLKLNHADIYDNYQRINAVNLFKTLPEAASLAAANKRVMNILNKETQLEKMQIDTTLFEKDAENALFAAIEKMQSLTGDYASKLKTLATLNPVVNDFFEHVMVNADDPNIKRNRLALLQALRTLFLQVADVAYLQ